MRKLASSADDEGEEEDHRLMFLNGMGIIRHKTINNFYCIHQHCMCLGMLELEEVADRLDATIPKEAKRFTARLSRALSLTAN